MGALKDPELSNFKLWTPWYIIPNSYRNLQCIENENAAHVNKSGVEGIIKNSGGNPEELFVVQMLDHLFHNTPWIEMYWMRESRCNGYHSLLVVVVEVILWKDATGYSLKT